MEKTLILMRGLPGSGKTTRVKEIIREWEDRHNTFSVSIGSADAYFGSGKEEYIKNFSIEKLPDAHEWCQANAMAAMRAGTDLVIVDNCNVKNIYMQAYSDKAFDLGYRVQYEEPTSPIWKNGVLPIIRPLAWSNRPDYGIIKDVCNRLSKNTEETHCVSFNSILCMLFAWEELS